MEQLRADNARHDDPAVEVVETNISNTVLEIFGKESKEYEQYQNHEIWHGDFTTYDTDEDRQTGFTKGIKQDIAAMNGLINRLEEKKEDLSLSVQTTQVEHVVKGEGVSDWNRDFYRLLEDGGWVDYQTYRPLFAGSDDIKKQRLATAIGNGKIEFQIVKNTTVMPVFLTRDLDNNQLKFYIADLLSFNSRNKRGYRVRIEAESFLAWLKENYPLEETKQMNPPDTIKEKTSNCSLVEILNLLTPEMYPDGLKGQEKGAITKSLNTLKEQLPEAFELCCSLVMEAMPCGDRKEHLKYTRDDVVQQAKERGINRPMALQIHKGLPAVMKK